MIVVALLCMAVCGLVVGWLSHELYLISKRKDFPPKGWSSHQEIRKGDYQIRYGHRLYRPFFKDEALYGVADDLDAGWAIKRCEEHAFKEQIKREIAKEYGLTKEATE
jgi:hypothetical protein